jgi:AcrR family transcriptional regulator
MASNRRIGLEQSKTRARLLDAAEEIMREEGYAAVSSRRVAGRAGLKPQLVHYYFRTMDDLFLALFRQRTEEGIAQHAIALALDSDRPLEALWDLSRDPEGTAMIIEFSALANHRKVIAAEIARYGERLRALQIEAIGRILAARGVGPEIVGPEALALVVASLTLFLRLEDGIGMSGGHAEVEAQVRTWLQRIDAHKPKT